MKTLVSTSTYHNPACEIVFPLNNFSNQGNFRTCVDVLPVLRAVTAVAVAAPADLPVVEPAVVAAGVCCL